MAGLVIQGMTGEPFSFAFDDLKYMPDVAQVRDISRLDARRSGSAVPLWAILPDDERRGAKWITLVAEKGRFCASLPLDDVLERGLVIYAENGRALPPDKGGPFRFWVPDAAACHKAEVDACANVKGLERIELSAERGRDTRAARNC
jgi:DMSO/TMAO reductase YedYZ molybdopterin-dependent catalytic subunit